MTRAILCLLIATAGSAYPQSGETTLRSPDGRLAITFRTVSNNQPAPAGGQLVYSVGFQGRPLIDASTVMASSPCFCSIAPSGASRARAGSTPRLAAT